MATVRHRGPEWCWQNNADVEADIRRSWVGLAVFTILMISHFVAVAVEPCVDWKFWACLLFSVDSHHAFRDVNQHPRQLAVRVAVGDLPGMDKLKCYHREHEAPALLVVICASLEFNISSKKPMEQVARQCLSVINTKISGNDRITPTIHTIRAALHDPHSFQHSINWCLLMVDPNRANVTKAT